MRFSRIYAAGILCFWASALFLVQEAVEGSKEIRRLSNTSSLRSFHSSNETRQTRQGAEHRRLVGNLRFWQRGKREERVGRCDQLDNSVMESVYLMEDFLQFNSVGSRVYKVRKVPVVPESTADIGEKSIFCKELIKAMKTVDRLANNKLKGDVRLYQDPRQPIVDQIRQFTGDMIAYLKGQGPTTSASADAIKDSASNTLRLIESVNAVKVYGRMFLLRDRTLAALRLIADEFMFKGIVRPRLLDGRWKSTEEVNDVEKRRRMRMMSEFLQKATFFSHPERSQTESSSSNTVGQKKMKFLKAVNRFLWFYHGMESFPAQSLDNFALEYKHLLSDNPDRTTQLRSRYQPAVERWEQLNESLPDKMDAMVEFLRSQQWKVPNVPQFPPSTNDIQQVSKFFKEFFRVMELIHDVTKDKFDHEIREQREDPRKQIVTGITCFAEDIIDYLKGRQSLTSYIGNVEENAEEIWELIDKFNNYQFYPRLFLLGPETQAAISDIVTHDEERPDGLLHIFDSNRVLNTLEKSSTITKLKWYLHRRIPKSTGMRNREDENVQHYFEKVGELAQAVLNVAFSKSEPSNEQIKSLEAIASEFLRHSKQSRPESIVDKLRSVKHDQMEGVVGETEECTICLDEFSDERDREIIVTPCNHVMHKDCLEKWVSSTRKDEEKKCPTCRDDLSKPYPEDSNTNTNSEIN